ncbi:MAG: hypothetical protein K0U12_01460, partial [Gammaproteobacteria bacterium]|nr:hypothetical protein [Gammaproteobacteria bacterium]
MKTSNLNARIRSHFPQIDEDGKKINFIENILPVLKQKPFEFNKLLEVLKNQASQQSASMHRQCTEALIKFINSSDFSFLRQDRYKKTSYLFGGITFVTSTSEFKQFNQGLSDYLTGLEEVDAIQNSSSSAVGGVIAAGILGFLRTCLSSAAKSPGNALCTLLVFSRQMVGVMSDSNAAVPGGGYSNDMQMTTVTPCFDVNQTYIGSSSGLVQFGSTITFDQLEESLNVNVEAEAGIGGFSASASASYANMVKDTAYSASFIFNNLIKFPQLLVQPMGYAEDALNNFGKEVYEKGHDNFGITCGDRAITRISTGASLYAAVRVNFATQEEKSEYSGKMKAGITGLGSVEREIQ